MGEPSLFDALVRVAIVFALLGVTLRVVGRVTGRRGPSRGIVRRAVSRERPTVEILDRQNLGRAASVALVRIGDRRVALGVTEQRVSLLLELAADPPEEPDAPALDAADDDDAEDLLLDLRDPARTPAARTRAEDPRRPWKDLIEDLRERTVR